MVGGSARWLLIGNSRWHWAEAGPEGLQTWHGPAPMGEVAASQAHSWNDLLAWAAVGPVPAGLPLPAQVRLTLAEVPLLAMPPWLGIDRALAGWQAWRWAGGPVLVADAGTVLSLTRVDAAGRFRGGRLLAGSALQLRAMAAATAGLNWSAEELCGDPAGPRMDPWPLDTAAAMATGVRLALAAAVVAAAVDLAAEAGPFRLVLTGGDGMVLLPLIERQLSGLAIAVDHRPDLCLEALALLRPGPGANRVQSSPRSARI